MANRVTAAELSPLVPGMPVTGLDFFITTANLVVNESLLNAGLSEARLKLIETYLAGHYATISYGEKSMEKVGDAQATFVKGASGKGFLETALGRQAVAFDTTGILVGIGGDTAEFSLIS